MGLRLSILVLLWSMAGAAYAVDLSVFGLPPFGTVFKPPPCKMGRYVPAPPKKGVCFVYQDTRLRQLRVIPGDSLVDVVFPNGEQPSMVYGDVQVRMLGGAIEGVSFGFKYYHMHEVAQQLKLKYGPPGDAKKTELQNGFGAKYDGLDANWNLPELDVSFTFPYLDRGDEGRVVITSRKAADADLARYRKSISHARAL